MVDHFSILDQEFSCAPRHEASIKEYIIPMILELHGQFQVWWPITGATWKGKWWWNVIGLPKSIPYIDLLGITIKTWLTSSWNSWPQWPNGNRSTFWSAEQNLLTWYVPGCHIQQTSKNRKNIATSHLQKGQPRIVPLPHPFYRLYKSIAVSADGQMVVTMSCCRDVVWISEDAGLTYTMELPGDNDGFQKAGPPSGTSWQTLLFSFWTIQSMCRLMMKQAQQVDGALIRLAVSPKCIHRQKTHSSFHIFVGCLVSFIPIHPWSRDTLASLPQKSLLFVPQQHDWRHFQSTQARREFLLGIHCNFSRWSEDCCFCFRGLWWFMAENHHRN